MPIRAGTLKVAPRSNFDGSFTPNPFLKDSLLLDSSQHHGTRLLSVSILLAEGITAREFRPYSEKCKVGLAVRMERPRAGSEGLMAQLCGPALRYPRPLGVRLLVVQHDARMPHVLAGRRTHITRCY